MEIHIGVTYEDNLVITGLLHSISIVKLMFPLCVMTQAGNLMKFCLVNKNERPNIFSTIKDLLPSVIKQLLH